MTGGLALQYPITLPTDYDMQVIRDRVRTRGHAFDDRAGLAVKAFCVRQAGVAGSPVNQYAPFYLWSDVDAASAFLWRGAGFDGIVRDFGRPAVRTWLPETRVLGPVPAASVTRALVRVTPIPADVDLVDTVARLVDRVQRHVGDDRVHLALGGVDPRTWTVVECATVGDADVPVAPDTTVFEVLHVSQPEKWT